VTGGGSHHLGEVSEENSIAVQHRWRRQAFCCSSSTDGGVLFASFSARSCGVIGLSLLSKSSLRLNSFLPAAAVYGQRTSGMGKARLASIARQKEKARNRQGLLPLDFDPAATLEEESDATSNIRTEQAGRYHNSGGRSTDR